MKKKLILTIFTVLLFSLVPIASADIPLKVFVNGQPVITDNRRITFRFYSCNKQRAKT